MVSISRKNEPLKRRRKDREITNNVGTKHSVWEGYGFDCGLSQFEGEDAGGREAVEHDDCGEVSPCFVGAVERFGEDQSGGKEFQGYVEECRKRLLRLPL